MPAGVPALPDKFLIQTSKVLDWCIDFSEEAPSVWLVTKTVWFKLLAPAQEYASTWAGLQQKYDLCVRAARALKAAPELPARQQLPHVLKAGVSGTSSKVYDAKSWEQHSAFLAEQLESLYQVSLRQLSSAQLTPCSAAAGRSSHWRAAGARQAGPGPPVPLAVLACCLRPFPHY
jgi:hypothetical protein